MGERVTLVGAGLAGSLLAISLARQGFQVDVFERRPDMRRVNIGGGRSINLALSARGIHALHEAGLLDRVMEIAIPMKGRMIHPVRGELTFQRYGKDDTEVIYATSRSQLNMALMNAAERLPGVSLHFNRKCTGMNLATGELSLSVEPGGEPLTVNASTVIGTDGSASALRGEMQRAYRFNLSQQYLEYGYKELSIPSGPDGAWLLEKQALHIWPRGTFMLIALPNIDGSFTCTFFFPHEGSMSFAALDGVDRVNAFFREHFPDAFGLIPDLADQFFANPTGAMVTVKCAPWHAGGRMALVGDAAHAIVPFFGQGMNCAFEDCTILNDIIGNRLARGERGVTHGWWASVFDAYERSRRVNTDAIADMAVENFVEMRDLVAHPAFQLRKKVEQELHRRFPERFIPKYSMVTFHRIPYAVALSRGKMQEAILDELCEAISTPERVDWARAEEIVGHLDRISP